MVTVTVCGPFRSLHLRMYCVLKFPLCVGLKVTGSRKSESALKGSPTSGFSGAANGGLMFATPFTRLCVLPVLETWKKAVAFLPTGIVPKFTLAADAVTWLTAAVPEALRVTTACCPLLPTIVNEPVAGPGDVGAKVTCTAIDAPGLSLVPTAGRLLALNGAVGGITEVIVWVTVPRLAMSTFSVFWIPTGMSVRFWSGASGNVCVLGWA